MPKFYHKSVLVLLAFLHTSLCDKLSAQLLAPDINCSQVDVNGSTSVIWTAVNDPNSEFVAYHLFASVGGASFVEIAQITNIATTTFLDNINDATLDEICYYLMVEYNTGFGTLMSDPGLVHCNTFLTATPSSAPLGFADVSWTGESVSSYNLIWDDINTSWNNSAQITDGSGEYSVEVTTCNALMSFVVSTQLGTCLNVSNVAEGIFNDQTPPAVPLITSVSVSNGNPMITWEPSSSPDTEGYILYRCSNSGVAIAETLFVPTTSYVDANINSAVQSGCYLLAAFDGCPNGNPPSPIPALLEVHAIVLFYSHLLTNCLAQIRFNCNGRPIKVGKMGWLFILFFMLKQMVDLLNWVLLTAIQPNGLLILMDLQI